MAQLRGDSKVGGKPIVTLDIMDNFSEQTKINIETDLMDLDELISDTVKGLNPLFTSNNIKEDYSPKINQGILAIELSVTKDIKYILNWFNINIEIKDAMRKNT